MSAWALAPALFLLAVTLPAEAQLTRAERDATALRARSNDEVDRAPVPADHLTLRQELTVVSAERDAIELGTTTAVQWLGALAAIAGGVCIGVGAIVAATTGNFGDTFVDFAIPGGIAIAVGVVLLAVAETDDRLHRARTLDHRIERLRVGLSVAANGLTLRF